MLKCLNTISKSIDKFNLDFLIVPKGEMQHLKLVKEYKETVLIFFCVNDKKLLSFNRLKSANDKSLLLKEYNEVANSLLLNEEIISLPQAPN